MHSRYYKQGVGSHRSSFNYKVNEVTLAQDNDTTIYNSTKVNSTLLARCVILRTGKTF